MLNFGAIRTAVSSSLFVEIIPKNMGHHRSGNKSFDFPEILRFHLGTLILSKRWSRLGGANDTSSNLRGRELLCDYFTAANATVVQPTKIWWQFLKLLHVPWSMKAKKCTFVPQPRPKKSNKKCKIDSILLSMVCNVWISPRFNLRDEVWSKQTWRFFKAHAQC